MSTECDRHFYEPADGHGLAHDPFNAIIAPRPIGWISSLDPHGTRNLAPYSFFNGFNYRPPIIGFSSINRKDSVRNVEAAGEFTWNLVTMDLAKQMNETSAVVAPEVDEFDLAGLEAAPSRLVKPQRVAASPVSFECRVTQIVRLADVDGAELDTWVVFGQVVGVHIDRRYLKDGVYDTTAAHPILRTGGPGGYVEIRPDAAFEMLRPEGAYRG